MDTKNLLKKYYSRLAKESIIKALMLGLIIGFSVLLLSSAVWWLAGLKSFWLCFIFFAVATAGATPIFYYRIFRPTIKQTAKRIDALGLEERLLTMTELERETSFMAIRQREDATSALKTVNEKLIKFAVSTSLVVALAIVTVFGVGMSTVAGLSANGVIKSGKDLIDDVTKPEQKQFEITYEVLGDGIIDGEIFQIVDEGESATAVMAVPMPEWVFAGWSDGYGDPYRLDTEVSKDMTIYAIFEEVETSDGEPGKPDEPGDDENDIEIDNNSENTATPNPNPGPDDGVTAYEDNNLVFDNETFYGGNVFDNAYNDMMDGISENGSSEDCKDIIEDYFNTIKK